MKFQCGGGERGSDPSSITLDEHKRTPELIWQWTRTFSPELKGWYIISLYSHFNWPPANLTDLPGIGLPSSYNHRQETSSISWYNIPAVVIASSKWMLHHQCANHRFLNTLGMTVFFRQWKKVTSGFLTLLKCVDRLHSCSPAPTGGSGICRKWKPAFFFSWRIPSCAATDHVMPRSLSVSGKSWLVSCDGEFAVVSGTQLLRSARHLRNRMLLLRSDLLKGLSSTSAFLL